MLLNDLWDLFKNEVFPFPSTEELFNQYRENDLRYDLPQGNEIRKRNLLNYLKSFTRKPRVLIIGEAAGPRGCRFSGIPFTGERLLVNKILPFKGRQSSTHDPPYSEISGTIFWKALLPRHPRFFVWNAIPFHPHKRSQILSIRNPTKGEILSNSTILSKVKSLLKPRHVVAVGRTAEIALRYIGSPSIYVRHPSQSGASEFRKGIERIFKEL